MKTIVCATFFFFGLISVGLAVKCYECNSHEMPECKDMSSKALQSLVDCDSKTNDTHVYTLCRKLHMFMDEQVGENLKENRIHRACGYVEDEDMYKRGNCYYKSGYNTRTWVCSCKDDECNAASTTLVSLAGLVSLLVVARLM
ncbi:uncharacterized protein LOC108678901 [Hyalella azteca]|uniref:Uncharacterized protein LOC108678901 n=1 Tax=Hyalella azteca TaxID=294128 RepID=A0A8B7P9Z5_HYAAZ|nr:uncharacterized protein LOC108678901 [Hyalella azteca]